MLVLVFLSILLSVLAEDNALNQRKGRDSYLDALKISHSGIKSDRDFNPNVETIHSEIHSTPQHKPEFPYPSAPSGPSPQYGPPKTIYGPPSQSYGSPISMFALPQKFYGMPHAMLGLFDKIKLFKMDLYTMGKILLKIVIFKKIVSLLAILCLLLFIPSLKRKDNSSGSSEDDSNEDSMMMMRNIEGTTSSGEASLNNMTVFVLEAIEKFGHKQSSDNRNCNTVYCRIQKVLTAIDKKVSYKKLANLYLKDVK